MESRQFPCSQCGANLNFAPGTDSLKCPYCGYVNPIESGETTIEELDYLAHLRHLGEEQETMEVMTVKCQGCGAETTFDPNITSDRCAFCDTPLVQTRASRRLIKPQALLPFKIESQKATELFRTWKKKLWFAPNAVKEHGRRESGLDGMYIPHWTYDTNTHTDYTGQRGEYYYVTETYTTVENGKTVTRTRQVRKTRWYPAAGHVYNSFDDILVVASESLPRKYMKKLEPWDLEELAGYDDAFLSGFRSESYSINLEQGFEIACQYMEPTIEATIRRDIGGDEQRIFSKNTRYSDTTFKHILLPVWISSYRFKDKTYRFLVNARTGEVQGERPWSWVKITLAVLAAAIVIAAIIYFASTQ